MLIKLNYWFNRKLEIRMETRTIIRRDKLIKEFIKKTKEKYPGLKINYNYDEEDDVYFIEHDNSDLEYSKNSYKYINNIDDFHINQENDEKSKEFNQFTSNLLDAMFYKKEIWNVCFSYGYKELKNKK